jgi:UDP-glucose 4-epimerase/UDP-glucuronate decarboxylase
VSGRFLVTGAAGLVGFEAARLLCERGHSVRAIDRFRKGPRADLDALAARFPGRLEIVAADLARETAALRGERWESVFHLAAIVGVAYVRAHPYETLDVNLRSTLNVLDACIERAPGSVIFSSSSENYAAGVDAGRLPLPTPEGVELGVSDVAEPRWSYAASKIAGESLLFSAAREAAFVPIVARLHNVYGPRMPPTHVVPELLARCRAKTDPFPVYGPEQTRSFLHVSDCASALLVLHEKVREKQGGIYNIGSGREVRIDELARMCFAVSGHHPRFDNKPHSPGSVMRRVPDVRKLEALGWKQTIRLEDGLAECWKALARS